MAKLFILISVPPPLHFSVSIHLPFSPRNFSSLPLLSPHTHPPTHPPFFLPVNKTGVLAHSLPNSYAFTEINRAGGDGRRTGEKQAGGKQRDREEGEGKGGTMTTKLLHSRYMIIFATVCQHACMI